MNKRPSWYIIMIEKTGIENLVSMSLKKKPGTFTETSATIWFFDLPAHFK